MKRLFFPALLIMCLFSCEPKPDYSHLGPGLFARVATDYGDIMIRLAHDKAPLTVANFVALAEGEMQNNFRGEGEPFFDGLTFHRVEPRFVIQGGDPLANGLGNPGYAFRQEIHPDLTHNVAGTVAMANGGPNTNGCQWYITLNPTPQLDGGYNVFGYVTEGMTNVYKIQRNDTIRGVEIIRNDSAAKAFDALEVFTQKR